MKGFLLPAHWKRSCARWCVERFASTRLRARSTLPMPPIIARCRSGWWCLWMRRTWWLPWPLPRDGRPVLSRGGGTSLAGQCCNVAVIIDFSKYMHGILELDPAQKFARVQPGIVLDRLRDAAEEHDLTFAPDPATHSRCTLGGMIGNNSCGVHALMGGKTVDNIESLDILLYDGTRITVGATSEAELASHHRRGRTAGRDLCRAGAHPGYLQRPDPPAFPKIPRRVSGYNLDELLPENGFNVARALVGSEGTCVTVLQSRCTLKHSPQHRRLVVLGFADPFIAADHVPAVLEYKPIGLEGFDGLMVDYMLRKHWRSTMCCCCPKGAAFCCASLAPTRRRKPTRSRQRLPRRRSLSARRARCGATPMRRRKRVWQVRESALGATVFVPGEKHGWEGWEDSAVPPEELGSYLREHYQLLDSMATRRRCTGTSARAAFTCASPSTWRPRRASPNFASLSTRPRISFWRTADRCRANTGMDSHAGRCCRKCMGRS